MTKLLTITLALTIIGSFAAYAGPTMIIVSMLFPGILVAAMIDSSFAD